MAVKKSELYSTLWAGCDALRGGMDASQYKDYVLTLLFVKYVSDKYKNAEDSLIEIPEGASFDDMIALKDKDDIGEKINTQILRPLFAANDLEGEFEIADFNDDDKLGSGKDKIDRLTKLIAVFENQALDFKNNRAGDDDILGDAYEFLMRHFATQSGKSKGQFYTPAEVSRILAKIIDAEKISSIDATVYDPCCGSGSLLLKVADETKEGITIYGQEKDIATKGLAIMNMWLHGNPEADIKGGNSIAKPMFVDTPTTLKRFDLVVANPPFSVSNWSSGITPNDDDFNRFKGYGIPPDKNGDYAFLLHIIASLKSNGKGAVILPHGVLFRGNAEAAIRQNLIERRYIKGIIGLPANLFYGTGIPACIIVIDKANASQSQGIFMVDASKGYIKDGNKNRLRDRDIHKIVSVFKQQLQIDKFSRLVPYKEIEKNEYNLNLPRYINTQIEDEIQSINAHLNGGIPVSDIDKFNNYWQVFPTMRQSLFEPLRKNFEQLKVEQQKINVTINDQREYKKYFMDLMKVFFNWFEKCQPQLASVYESNNPKALINDISARLLFIYKNEALVDNYSIYQLLMDYWNEVMKDDTYLIIEDGWVAKTRRIIELNKQKKEVDKGWTCDLLPKQLIVNRFFREQHDAWLTINSELEHMQNQINEMHEEHAIEDGLLAEFTNDKGKITKTNLTKALKNVSEIDEEAKLKAIELKTFFENEAKLKKLEKTAFLGLDKLAYLKYSELTKEEVKTLVIEDKWQYTLNHKVQNEMDTLSRNLSNGIKTLAIRYESTLNVLANAVTCSQKKVGKHLEKMGY